MIPIVLDTDIGTDIDDAYALVLCVVSPELDLRAVTIVNNDVELRGRIAGKLLRDLAYECPIGLGESNRLDGTVTPGSHGNEGDGIDLEPVEFSPFHAKDLIVKCVMEGCRTIVGIGQMTNIALALRGLPDGIKREIVIYQMATSFRGYGREAAEREHNAACDIAALKETLDSGAFVKLVGLNVTRETSMSREDLQIIEGIGGQLPRDLAGMHKVWFDYIGRDESPMHDPLTVAAVFDHNVLDFEPVSAEVLQGEQLVVFDTVKKWSKCEAAIDINAVRFQELFAKRIRNAMT